MIHVICPCGCGSLQLRVRSPEMPRGDAYMPNCPRASSQAASPPGTLPAIAGSVSPGLCAEGAWTHQATGSRLQGQGRAAQQPLVFWMHSAEPGQDGTLALRLP